MRLLRVMLSLALVILLTGHASAQSTTGAIRGHVDDAQGLPLPGVTVSVTSPNLQGTRATVTAENGDFVLVSLPSGPYTVSFELSGFGRRQSVVMIAPTQDVPLNVTLGVAGMAEDVTIVGRTADVLTQTSQVATNISHELVAMLPTTRDINAYMLLAPGVHASGPGGAYSIAGAATFESLYLVNGVTVNENLRGQPNELYIEDAIQETTVATAGISAEFGRFSGGVVNIVTKSGGNTFSGSLRETMFNDKWRTLTPLEKSTIATNPAHKELRVDKVVPTLEYTFGGPVLKNHLWFFTAGRVQNQSEGRQLARTQIPYTFERPSRRYEGKGTYSLNSNHRLVGAYDKVIDAQLNNTFNRNVSIDLASLVDRKTPQDLGVISYSGVLTSKLFAEATFSKRHASTSGDGSQFMDQINGTLMVDGTTGYRFWSPTFCGVCSTEHRDNDDLFGKVTYFLATDHGGSHTLTAGGDNFDDIRLANNYQSGSNFRIFNTGTIIRGTGAASVIYPVSLGDGTTFLQYQPIPVQSEGSDFRTFAAFANDSWRINGRMTANLGLRWSRNNGRNQEGKLTVKDSAFSPRLGLVIDPFGDQKWSLTGSFARYVTAVNNLVADSSSTAGNSQAFRYTYGGPSLNADPNAANLTPTADVIAQIFAWFNANGGTNLPLRDQPNLPGVSPQIRGSLKSPNAIEYASGVTRQFGNRAAIRADYIYRDYHDFYSQRTDSTTGRVSNANGQQFDLGLIENTDALKRRYSGVTTQGTYRLDVGTDVGATYTLSRTWGNFNGENVNSGPVTSDFQNYPEYRQESWNYPEGDLQADQRHRARLWVNYRIPKVRSLTVSLLQTLDSGTPFGPNNLNNPSANGVNSQLYVVNTVGYLTPPTGTTTLYYYSADCSKVPASFAAGDISCHDGAQRDAFRLNGQKRSDLAVNYNYGLKTGSRTLDLFFHLSVINLFDQSQLCGCGGTIFQNGGTVVQTTIDQTIRTNVSNPATYAAFNPFTDTPVQGQHWDYGPNFGTALNRAAYTTPRTLNFGFGVRF